MKMIQWGSPCKALSTHPDTALMFIKLQLLSGCLLIRCVKAEHGDGVHALFHMWASRSTRGLLPRGPPFVLPYVSPSHMWAAWESAPGDVDRAAGRAHLSHVSFPPRNKFFFSWRSPMGWVTFLQLSGIFSLAPVEGWSPAHALWCREQAGLEGTHTSHSWVCVMASFYYRAIHFKSHSGAAGEGDTNIARRDARIQISALWSRTSYLGFLGLSFVINKMGMITLILHDFFLSQDATCKASDSYLLLNK